MTRWHEIRDLSLDRMGEVFCGSTAITSKRSLGEAKRKQGFFAETPAPSSLIRSAHERPNQLTGDFLRPAAGAQMRAPFSSPARVLLQTKMSSPSPPPSSCRDPAASQTIQTLEEVRVFSRSLEKRCVSGRSGLRVFRTASNDGVKTAFWTNEATRHWAQGGWA